MTWKMVVWGVRTGTGRLMGRATVRATLPPWQGSGPSVHTLGGANRHLGTSWGKIHLSLLLEFSKAQRWAC